MPLLTREFALSRKQFLGILLRATARRAWWVALIPLAVALFVLPSGDLASVAWTLGLYLVALPALILLFLWRQAYDPRNRMFLLRRRHEIDDEFFHTRLEDGTASRFPLAAFLRVERGNGAYRLFTTPRQFVHLPFNVFATPADRAAFETILSRRGVPLR